MKKPLTRALTALSILSAAAMLSACGGATSTVDPFKPTRVIGLGDSYNVTTSNIYTVQGTGTVESVVAQVGASFGVASSSVLSQAANDAVVSDLAGQISAITAFDSSDLVVIAVGSRDIQAAYSAAVFDATASNAAATTAAGALVDHVKTLLNRGARHILIMQPLEFSVTPLAATNRTKYPLNTSSSPTETFNTKVKGDLQVYISHQGFNGNPVIFGGAGLSSDFNNFATQAIASQFVSPSTPWCTGTIAHDPSNTVGCVSDATTGDGSYLFADGVHLTPLGNRWVAGYLYNATAQGWR